MNAFLTAGAVVAGPSLPGRPTQSMSLVVPAFVSTFANPSMSVFSLASAYNLPTSATRDVAYRPFIRASGFCPCEASLLLKSWPASTST